MPFMVCHTYNRFVSHRYRTDPFFNGFSSFKAAFPMLSDALIEWRERRGPDDDQRSDLRKTGFRRGNFTQGVLSCSNPACHEGGYAIDRLVDDMVRLEETERRGIMLCCGRETGEDVRRGPIRCPYRIEYSVTLVPRPEEAPRERVSPRRGRRGPRRSRVA